MFSRSTQWVDANGQSTIIRLNTATGISAPLRAAIAAMSNASEFNSWESVVATLVPAPAAAQFQSVVDRLPVQFLCADNTVATILIPAPVAAVFLADLSTLDPANGLVGALAAAAIPLLVNTNGSPAVALIGSKRAANSKAPL